MTRAAARGDVTSYLGALAQVMRTAMGDDFVGAYLQGSAAQGDSREGRSDLDVVGVALRPVAQDRLEALAREIAHERLPVPAAGLDLMIVTEAFVREPGAEPRYELWSCTGATWPTEVNVKGATSEVVLVLATCAAGARTIAGRPAQDVFRPVAEASVLGAMIDALEWHRTRILDAFHDPSGQHSVLNAARNWRYAVERRLGSKAEGGRWALAREPGNELLRNALRARDGDVIAEPSAEEIDAFLRRALAACREALS